MSCMTSFIIHYCLTKFKLKVTMRVDLPLHDGESITMDKIKTIIDDIWIHCFLFLNISDFLAVHSTNTRFNKLTNHLHQGRIKQFWKSQCIHLCTTVSINQFETDNWKLFYQKLLDFLTRAHYFDPLLHFQHSLPRHGIILEKKRQESDINQAMIMDCVPIFRLLLNLRNTTKKGDDVDDCNRHDRDQSKHNSNNNQNSIDTHKFDNNTNTSKKTLPINKKQNNKSNIKTFNLGNDSAEILAMAAGCAATNIFSYILQCYPEIDPCPRYGFDANTPLMTACFNGNIEIVELLLKHPKVTKERINCNNTWGDTALDYAINREGLTKKNGVTLLDLFLNDDRVDVIQGIIKYKRFGEFNAETEKKCNDFTKRFSFGNLK